jgi:hypothetical protein
MAARSLVFAACAYNLAETTRMLEIARAVTRQNNSDHRFDVQFISDGGDFESLIENAGFPLKRLEPRMTAEKIEYAYKLDRGEAFGSVMSADEAIEKTRNEVAFLQDLKTGRDCHGIVRNDANYASDNRCASGLGRSVNLAGGLSQTRRRHDGQHTV